MNSPYDWQEQEEIDNEFFRLTEGLLTPDGEDDIIAATPRRRSIWERIRRCVNL